MGEVKPVQKRSEQLPDNLEDAFSANHLCLFGCKPNHSTDGGGQPGTDFKNLRVLVHMSSMEWKDEIGDAHFYEYTIRGTRRYLLSEHAFKVLNREAGKVCTCEQTPCALLHSSHPCMCLGHRSPSTLSRGCVVTTAT